MNYFIVRSVVLTKPAKALICYIFEFPTFADNPCLTCQPPIKPLMQFFVHAVQNARGGFRLLVVFVVVVIRIHVYAMP